MVGTPRAIGCGPSAVEEASVRAVEQMYMGNAVGENLSLGRGSSREMRPELVVQWCVDRLLDIQVRPDAVRKKSRENFSKRHAEHPMVMPKRSEISISDMHIG